MHIRRQLMACQGQGATSVVVFEDGVDPSAVEEKPKPPDDSESVFTYSSLKQFSASVITTTQDMLSRQSKAASEEQPQTEEKSVATPIPNVTSTKSIFKKLTFCSDSYADCEISIHRSERLLSRPNGRGAAWKG